MRHECSTGCGTGTIECVHRRWLTEGETVPSRDEPAERIVASDIYQWVPGGRFVMHPAYGRIGTIDVGGLEVIGYDASTGSFKRTFSTAKGTRSAKPCPAT